jgi:hypothetical protein
MVKHEPDTEATERSVEPGHGPQTLGDADFLVGRTLRRDLRLPVGCVREVTSENKIVLDLPATEAKELGEKVSLGEGAPGAGSMSENPGKEEKGTWGLRKGE